VTRGRVATTRRAERLARAVIVGGVLLLAHVPAQARRVVVQPTPIAPAPGLDSALASAQPGDTILLRPGLYRGCYDLHRGVSIIGVAGPDSTILDAAGGEYVLSGRGLDSTTVIARLTLQNGRRSHANSGGGGIYLYESSPVILNNVFRDHLGYLGSGIYTNYGCRPVIAFNVLHDNEGYLGGAIAAYEGCAPLVYNNVIHDNRAVSGGAILCLNSAPVVLHNTMVGNVAKSKSGAGIYCDSSPALVEANVLAFNGEGGAVYWLDDDRPATLRRNLLWQNTAGDRGGACPEFVGRDGNRREDPGFPDLPARRLWRAPAAGGAPPAGAAAWDRRSIPSVPDSVLAAWRAWRRAQASR